MHSLWSLQRSWRQAAGVSTRNTSIQPWKWCSSSPEDTHMPSWCRKIIVDWLGFFWHQVSNLTQCFHGTSKRITFGTNVAPHFQHCRLHSKQINGKSYWDRMSHVGASAFTVQIYHCREVVTFMVLHTYRWRLLTLASVCNWLLAQGQHQFHMYGYHSSLPQLGAEWSAVMIDDMGVHSRAPNRINL